MDIPMCTYHDVNHNTHPIENVFILDSFGFHGCKNAGVWQGLFEYTVCILSSISRSQSVSDPFHVYFFIADPCSFTWVDERTLLWHSIMVNPLTGCCYDNKVSFKFTITHLFSLQQFWLRLCTDKYFGYILNLVLLVGMRWTWWISKWSSNK